METEIKFVPAKIEADDSMVAFQVAVAQARELGRQLEKAAKELLSYPAGTLLKRGIMKKLRPPDLITLVINPPDSNYSHFAYNPLEVDFFYSDQVLLDGIVIECQQSPEEKFTIFRKITGRHFYPTVELTKEKVVFAIPEDPEGSKNYPEYLEVSSRHNVFYCTIKKDGWSRSDPAFFEGQPGMEEVRSVTDIVKEITGRARLFFSQS